MTARPDPNRPGGLGWLERTGGSMTAGERRSLLGVVVRAQVDNLAGRIRLNRGRRPPHGAGLDADALAPPDSAACRVAMEAADHLPAALRNHSYRTWIYGTALAAVDGATVDPELFFVAATLHDAGLTEAVPGECFTLRSGRVAAACFADDAEAGDVVAVRDAIAVHAQPGICARRDGELGYFLQSGAMLDIVGARLWDLSRDVAAAATRRFEWADLHADLSRRIAAEAAAVPHGRFAFVRRCGFGLAMRAAPAEIRGA